MANGVKKLADWIIGKRHIIIFQMIHPVFGAQWIMREVGEAPVADEDEEEV